MLRAPDGPAGWIAAVAGVLLIVVAVVRSILGDK